jgi:hypothetical protein
MLSEFLSLLSASKSLGATKPTGAASEMGVIIETSCGFRLLIELIAAFLSAAQGLKAKELGNPFATAEIV